MKVRKIKHTFWWMIDCIERKLTIKVKPLPGMKFVGYGKDKHLVKRK